MLADVNKDIERQAKGEAPVLAGVAKVAEKADDGAVEKVEAAKTPVPEATKAVPAEVAKAPAAEAGEAQAKVEPVDAAMADAVRKQQLQVIAAYDLIDEAYDLMDEGNWDEASRKLAFAGESFPRTRIRRYPTKSAPSSTGPRP